MRKLKANYVCFKGVKRMALGKIWLTSGVIQWAIPLYK